MTAGIYHSIYDDFYWYTHFSDTSFVYGRALAQTAGTASCGSPTPTCCRTTTRISPRRCTRYIDELQKLATARATTARERNREIEEGIVQRDERSAQSDEDAGRARRAAAHVLRGARECGRLAHACRASLQQGVRQGAAARRQHARGRIARARQRRFSRTASTCSPIRRGCRCVRGSSTCSTRRASTPATA